MLDIYSRYVVRWILAKNESGVLASKLIEDAVQDAGISAEKLTIHADRGTPMTSKRLIDKLVDLDVIRSHSRPRVSNDNAFSEPAVQDDETLPG